MSFREATVEYVFQSVSGAHVTSPTVAPHGGIAPFIPALPGRSFKNVSLMMAARHDDTFLADQTAWEVGVGLDTPTLTWYRRTNTFTPMGEHFWWYSSQDITSQFQSAWSDPNKETGIVSASFCFNGSTMVMGNFQAKLIVTYGWDDQENPLSGTLVKTVKIPIQSKTAVLTTTQEEFGGAGSWSIPVLDTFLPESGKQIEDVWIEFFSSDASIATTTFSMFWQFNGNTEQRMDTQDQSTNISLLNWYILKLKHIGGTFPSDIPPRILIRGDDITTSRYNTCGGFLGVTYRYSANSNRILNSLAIPLGGESGYIGSGSIGFSREEKTLNVQEPGPITVKNSGVMLSLMDSANVTVNMRMGSQVANLSQSQQAFRSYTCTAGTLTAGSHIITQRVDSGSLAGTGLILDRGENRIWCDWWSTALTSANGAGSGATALMLLNYESSCSISGAAAHNHTTMWTCLSGTTTQSGFVNIRENNIVKIPRWVNPPRISGSQWFLNSAGFWRQDLAFMGNTSNVFQIEDDDLENKFASCGAIFTLGEAENTNYLGWCDSTSMFWRHCQEWMTGSLFDPRKQRQFKIMAPQISWNNLWFLMTYHNIGYPVSASVKHFRDSAAGITVNVQKHTTKENLYRTTASADGSYSFLAYDDVTPLSAHATQSLTHFGSSENAPPSTIPSS